MNRRAARLPIGQAIAIAAPLQTEYAAAADSFISAEAEPLATEEETKRPIRRRKCGEKLREKLRRDMMKGVKL